MGCTTMGNSQGRNALREDDIAFLREHTALNTHDLALYESFLKDHPNGTISKEEFR